MSQQPSPSVLPRYASFAIAIPLFRVFDYSIDINQPVQPGIRYRLPFGHGSKVGVLLSTSQTTTFSAAKVKPALEALDRSPVLSEHILELARWIADYYLQPPGEVLFQCLPRYLRSAQQQKPVRVKVWFAEHLDIEARDAIERRSPRQHELLSAIEASSGLNAAQLKAINPNWHGVVLALESKQAIRWQWQKPGSADELLQPAPELNSQQAQVVEAMLEKSTGFSVQLLDGITGSGKTEVYFRLVENQLARNRQVIYLVPEIGLTSQLVERVKARFGFRFTMSHSGLTDVQRYQAWEQFRQGDVDIMLGTRSSLFSETERLGLIIIDEEHDSSYKQEDGIRYHARDVAIKRAQMLDIPIVLGSATPSLESLNNGEREHYALYRLTQRPTAYPPPRIQLIDTRNIKLDTGCSPQLIQKIHQHLKAKGQVLLYLNRRGFAPVVMCHECSWQSHCERCDSRLTMHQSLHRLLCHHCGYAQPIPPACPACGHNDIKHYGIGTEQLEQRLEQIFTGVPVIRIDRDSISGRDEFAARLQTLNKGEPCVLIGTQMIAKGHDYPAITLSAILDADQALFSASYRATEHLVQTVFQVSGRSGRGQQPGEALVQTGFSEHPLMQSLTRQSYREISEAILKERRLLGFPPHVRVVMFRADALSLELALDKLDEIRSKLTVIANQSGINCIGPIPALMTRRIGRYRAQLCLISDDFRKLRRSLSEAMPAIENIPSTHSVKWMIDVDAHDL
ncbi:MAG: primosomal protein N' [Gammaproteobacteria bacterium]|nr:primosomal protein N' [Gammaproteobacteria bacterium]